MTPIELRRVSAETVRPLRERILRPGADAEELQYPGDDHEHAFHVGAFSGDRLVGIGSIAPEMPPYQLQQHLPTTAFEPEASFRLRGMAVEPEYQGQSIGGKILYAIFEHTDANGSHWIWCNARVNALPFYEQHGFSIVEPPFELPKIGLHRLAFIER